MKGSLRPQRALREGLLREGLRLLLVVELQLRAPSQPCPGAVRILLMADTQRMSQVLYQFPELIY